jgi:antitoxin (DNA-binding transcriptional repressor) of toxin-antitoxin stability system
MKIYTYSEAHKNPEARKRVSTLPAGSRSARETILIMRRGRPIARLKPNEEPVKHGLLAVTGWLSADDPFLSAVDEIVVARAERRPRALRNRP